MRADVRKPGLNFGDSIAVGGGFRFDEERAALAIGAEHDLQQAFGAIGRFLRESFDARAGCDLQAAAFGRKLSGYDAEQGGLAGAVAADQPDAGSVGNVRAGGIKQEPAGDAH